MLGALAATSLLPKVFAKRGPLAAPTPGSTVATGRDGKFELRHDARVVARRDPA